MAAILRQLSLFFVLIFATSICSEVLGQPSSSVDKKDQKWMEKFFQDLLFKEGAAYTLWGSKPITEISVYHYTKEEMEEIISQIPKADQEDCYVNEDYDLPANWKRWEAVAAKYPLKQYLLFKSESSDDPKISYIYFVNVVKTALLIQDNYDLFRREVGFDFQPLEVVLQMPDKTSAFWEKIKNSENTVLLWGLLFGYGKQNASLFHWKYQGKTASERFFQNLASYHSNPNPKGRVNLTIKNLLLPPFISFSEEDETLIRYKKEREEIKKTYKNKDFLKTTLKQLAHYP